MEEFVCVTVFSNAAESESAFGSRLSVLWTNMLRENEAEFEQVYAESADFEKIRGLWSRQYLMGEAVVALVESKLKESGFDYEPIDMNDRFSRYEAVSPDWMQIEH